jgi:hypothetical protein
MLKDRHHIYLDKGWRCCINQGIILQYKGVSIIHLNILGRISLCGKEKGV